MKVIVNGKEESYENENLTINEFLVLKKVKMPEMVTIELNGEIIDRDMFKKIEIKDGDRIELIYYMGGGESKLEEIL